MTFYGKLTEPNSLRPLRKFVYRVYDGGTEREICAHEIYFYEAGRIGFWNDATTDGLEGERILVLATKAFEVREVIAK